MMIVVSQTLNALRHGCEVVLGCPRCLAIVVQCCAGSTGVHLPIVRQAGMQCRTASGWFAYWKWRGALSLAVAHWQQWPGIGEVVPREGFWKVLCRPKPRVVASGFVSTQPSHPGGR